MHFFENQHRARRKTGLLVALFLPAVLLIVLAINGLFYLILVLQSSTSLTFGYWLMSFQSLVCAAVVAGLIAVGSLIRHTSLRDGGESIAKMVGARRIPVDTNQALERRFRNVVEEIAIASGVVMPELFVMDNETAINAFVAGYEANEAVLVVTRGALENLTRDELQGVVAHEFSHLLNGDMRLNVRLIAVLAGILLLGQVGAFMMRSVGRTRSGRRDGRFVFAVAAAGLGLTLIGYIGVFFGRLIKSAVSRQREFLADASAVQFTRQQDGIGGALYKIGVGAHGGQLRHTVHAEELNHLCLGESIPRCFAGLLASHPPINSRIAAIDIGLLPRLQARYGRDGSRRTPMAPTDSVVTSNFGATAGFSKPLGENSLQVPRKGLAESAGMLTKANEDYAEHLLVTLPSSLTRALHRTELAIQLCYAVLLLPARRVPNLADAGSGLLAPEPLTIDALQHDLANLGPAYNIPCLELAVAALRPLEIPERKAFLNILDALAYSDGRLSLSELVTLGFLRKHLSSNRSQSPGAPYRRYEPVSAELESLLGVFATLGAPEPAARQALYSKTVFTFLAGPVGAIPELPGIKTLYLSLRKLNRLSPLLKQAVIVACGDCVTHDGKVSVREYELMRLVADQLDCPLPPLPSVVEG